MRIPVFARGANPAIDQPNQRKSQSYGLQEVEAGRADWIDATDHSKGILCRAFLYSGEALKLAQPEQVRQLSLRGALPPLEVHGTVTFEPQISLVKREDRHGLIVRARAFAHFCDLAAVAQA